MVLWKFFYRNQNQNRFIPKNLVFISQTFYLNFNFNFSYVILYELSNDYPDSLKLFYAMRNYVYFSYFH